MEKHIFGVSTSHDGVWFYASEVRHGKATSLDPNLMFASRMTKSQAEAVAAAMVRETGAFWYAVPVVLRRG